MSANPLYGTKPESHQEHIDYAEANSKEMKAAGAEIIDAFVKEMDNDWPLPADLEELEKELNITAQTIGYGEPKRALATRAAIDAIDDSYEKFDFDKQLQILIQAKGTLSE
jgi:hypothetical protein